MIICAHIFKKIALLAKGANLIMLEHCTNHAKRRLLPMASFSLGYFEAQNGHRTRVSAVKGNIFSSLSLQGPSGIEIIFLFNNCCFLALRRTSERKEVIKEATEPVPI
jgi:hypothetical protein